MTNRCVLIRPGLVSYSDGLRLQQYVWEQVAKGEYDGALLLLEHHPVITLGRSHEAAELLLPQTAYQEKGIELVGCNRGGKVTCHNPGQLVGYPILNLTKWSQDSHWYMRQLEQIIINTIAKFGLTGGRKTSYTGVWTGDKKIAAIGVAIRRWITSHGFALNVHNDLSIFSAVVPCGISEFGVTSMTAEGANDPSVAAVAAVLTAEFAAAMECTLTVMENNGVA